MPADVFYRAGGGSEDIIGPGTLGPAVGAGADGLGPGMLRLVSAGWFGNGSSGGPEKALGPGIVAVG